MEVDFNTDEMKVTSKGRRLRLIATIEHLQEHKKMMKDDLVRFIMKTWMLSKRIAENYVNELVATDKAREIETAEGIEIAYCEE